jgi:hypothetical protein
MFFFTLIANFTITKIQNLVKLYINEKPIQLSLKVFQVFVCLFSRSIKINENVNLILMGLFRTAYKKLRVVLNRLQKRHQKNGKPTFLYFISFHFISWISITLSYHKSYTIKTEIKFRFDWYIYTQ